MDLSLSTSAVRLACPARRAEFWDLRFEFSMKSAPRSEARYCRGEGEKKERREERKGKQG